MDTASFSGFIKAIFYIVAFYYIFKFLARIFMPLILKKVVEKAGQNFQQQYQQHQNQNQSYGSTQTDSSYTQPNQPKKFKSTKNIGEYVDYEEIE